jgi:2-dehydro-3-deoxygalactonokinase
MVVSRSAFLAVDWGTTNRRVYRIDGGQVAHTERDGLGVTSVRDFAAEVAALRGRFGDLPMLLAGMVGSNIGWREAPYVRVPAGLDTLATALLRIDERTAIVPGLSVQSPADVMRGEEVQLLGATAAGLAPPDAVLVQPGTHCKWVRMADGHVESFTTAMTGELFSLLRSHGILSPQLRGEVKAGAAFLAGVDEGKRRDLAASLFGIRASKLVAQRDDDDAASFASGLLIGSDVAARLAQLADDAFYLLADPALGELYAAAIGAHGRRAHLIDSQAAFVAGIIEVANRCSF